MLARAAPVAAETCQETYREAVWAKMAEGVRMACLDAGTADPSAAWRAVAARAAGVGPIAAVGARDSQDPTVAGNL